MEAKDTVMTERGSDYDADCGQIIACDILPKYIADVEACYLKISTVVEEFVEAERKAQAEISFKAGIGEVVEWYENEIGKLPTYPESFLLSRRAKLKEWGIENSLTQNKGGARWLNYIGW